ncbi:MAG: hypothetical protein IJM18_04335 [Clostridia bacterium]|nr:hypothetical protein [Clostridia bacterium]
MDEVVRSKKAEALSTSSVILAPLVCQLPIRGEAERNGRNLSSHLGAEVDG